MAILNLFLVQKEFGSQRLFIWLSFKSLAKRQFFLLVKSLHSAMVPNIGGPFSVTYIWSQNNLVSTIRLYLKTKTYSLQFKIFQLQPGGFLRSCSFGGRRAAGTDLEPGSLLHQPGLLDLAVGDIVDVSIAGLLDLPVCGALALRRNLPGQAAARPLSPRSVTPTYGWFHSRRRMTSLEWLHFEYEFSFWCDDFNIVISHLKVSSMFQINPRIKNCAISA